MCDGFLNVCHENCSFLIPSTALLPNCLQNLASLMIFAKVMLRPELVILFGSVTNDVIQVIVAHLPLLSCIICHPAILLTASSTHREHLLILYLLTEKTQNTCMKP